MSDRRIVLIGKTGSGKSTLGNNLLKQKKFRSASSAVSITKVCETGKRQLSNGTNLTVVDTPGLYDTDVSNEQRLGELARSLQLCRPGVHAFLFVLRIGRFTEEELETVTHLKTMFGDEILNYMIIVFTVKDSLTYEEIDLDDYIKQVPDSLKSFIRQCGNRVAAIDNRSSGSSLDADVNCILGLVETKIQRYGNNHLYTEAMYRRKEKRERERERELEMLRCELESLRSHTCTYVSHSDDDNNGCTIL